MKRFSTYVNEIDVHEQLPEGFVRGLTRSAAVIAQANASKRHGDQVVRYLRGVTAVLNNPQGQTSKDTIVRLERIEQSLDLMAKAMISFRHQLGASAAISASGALIVSGAKKRR